MNKELTTLFTGRQIIEIESVESTNSFLSGLLKTQLVPEGSIVRAYSQLSGRGQMGARWSSEDGKNLLVSFAFYPTFVVPRNIFLLNKTYALGVYDYIHSVLGNDVKIKWPNDIYWKSKKLGGILVENTITTTVVTNSILGLGLNVNQLEFPSNLPNPISIGQIIPGNHNLNSLLNGLSNKVESRYLQLRRGEKQTIDEDYKKALFRCEEWAFYEDKKGKFPGRIKGVDNQGLLKVEDEEGEIRLFDLKELKYLGLS
jgi:BirA family biotin operon repressor/biotin-[acetyl-CoA-carboxylase] ligase